jgi:Leucine-rich repeat (LRR) protein
MHLSGLPALQHLALGHNTISSIADAAFAHNQHLTSIDLQSNRLLTINLKVFNDIPLNLKSINFNGNVQLRFAVDQRFSTANLEEISCENCNVIDVGAFGALPHLKRLNLNGNKIVSIEREAFAGNGKLEAVYLERNRLERFDVDLVAPLKRLNTLCLAGNPLRQDAALEAVMEEKQLKVGCNEVVQDADDVDEVYFESDGGLITVGIHDDDIVFVRSKRYLDVLIGSYMFFVLIIEFVSLGLLIFYLVKYLKSLELDQELN